MAGGLTFAELGSMFPRTGGLYVFLEEAYGPVWGFLFGWAALLVVLTGSVAGVAVGFAEYFSYFVPALGTSRILWSRGAVDGVGRREWWRPFRFSRIGWINSSASRRPTACKGR